MSGWRKILKATARYVATIAACLYVAWLGVSDLYRYFTTGHSLVFYGARGSPKYWRLITFENDPFYLVTSVAIDIALTAVGLIACVGICLIIWRWWKHRRAIE